jgi:membrane-associated protein
MDLDNKQIASREYRDIRLLYMYIERAPSTNDHTNNCHYYQWETLLLWRGNISGYMDFTIFDLILHIDSSLEQMAGELGPLIYGVLFLIIFCETGFVVTPFLPGDSLLFVSGALAGSGVLNIWVLLLIIGSAAVIGDTVNFWIGRYAGCKIMEGRLAAFIHKEWLIKTHHYFETYGGITIVIARFVPIVRTFAPFLAGIGTMNYRWFLFYNVFGAVLWTGGLVGGGFLIGNIPIIQDNVSMLMWLVLGICIFSIAMILKAIISAFVFKKEKPGDTEQNQALEYCMTIESKK